MLFQVYARHAIEEITLQAQGDGRTRRLLDGSARARNIDALDGLAVHLAVVGDQPVVDDAVSILGVL